VARLSCQVTSLREATSPRIVLGIVHLCVKNLREPKRTPRRLEEDSRTNGNATDALADPYELTTSSLGPNSHVNLLLDVKVISS
jgi:hypothetical protein